jgi:hypothetical protein
VSQENVEIVRAATEAAKSPEAIERLAHGDMDAIHLISPEVEWDARGARDVVPDLADVYWGHEGASSPTGAGGLTPGASLSSTFRTTWTLATRWWS